MRRCSPTPPPPVDIAPCPTRQSQATWEVPIGKIAHDVVADWVESMVASGMSPWRIRQAVFVLSATCDYAIRSDRLVRNPAKGRSSPVSPVKGLRHTAASLYIAAGTPPKVVQRSLGHASVAFTLDVYGHLYPDEMDTWAARLDGAMWAKSGQEAPDESSEDV